MRSRATTPLSKAKVRQSWSKYNLYNLSRVEVPQYRQKTFYQQKWLAKSALRAYHGEPVREAHWTKLFRRRIRAVVPMSPQYLAQNDGSRESAGRGSGLKLEKDWEVQKTPYMNMAFAPLERRLDTAIFRSLFASSTRQARQFVIHGAVKVNGRKMRYPGYLLNPGDMFQVDPERVMFATGAPKQGKITKPVADTEDGAGEPAQTEVKEEIGEEAEEADDTPDDRTPRQILKDLQAQAKFILSSERANIGAKKKQALRGFTKSVKRLLSRSENNEKATDSLEDQFQELKLQLKVSEKKRQTVVAAAEKSQDSQNKEEKEGSAAEEVENEDEESNTLTKLEENMLLRALAEMNTNPIDPSKPYATPWRPRDYMSAFAFIPRYLEVNQNICAAVFLRHPVARPSLAEVPTPFSLETNGAAFTWYLRRR